MLMSHIFITQNLQKRQKTLNNFYRTFQTRRLIKG